MDIFGVGGPELFFFLILGGIILGPRRIVSLAREGKKLMGQIQTLTRDISNELNREIDLMDIAEGKKPAHKAKEQAEEDGEENLEVEEGEKLPDAYLNFREDFPDEGNLDDPPPEEVADQEKPPVRNTPRPVTIRSTTLTRARKGQKIKNSQLSSETSNPEQA